MKRKRTYSLVVLLAGLAIAACNSGNNAGKQEEMDTNYTDTRRNTTDTGNYIPDTAHMKVDTFQQPAPAQKQ